MNPKLGQRLVVLRDLVALGQVGIEIILACKNRSLVDAALQRHRRQRGELHDLLVEHGQRARHAKADWADIRIWWRPKPRGTRAKNLGCRQELNVDFQPDDWLILRVGGNGIGRRSDHKL